MKIQEIKEAVKNNLDMQIQSLLSGNIEKAKLLLMQKMGNEIKEISELMMNYKEIVKSYADIQLKEEISSKKLSLLSEASVLEKLDMYERIQKNSDQLNLQLTKISVNNSGGFYYTIRAEQSQYIVNKLQENLDSWISNHTPSLKDPEKLKDTMSLLFKSWQKNLDSTIHAVKEDYASLSIINKQITAKINLNKEDLSSLKIPTEYLILKAMNPTIIDKEVLTSNTVDKINSLRKEDKIDSSLKKK